MINVLRNFWGRQEKKWGTKLYAGITCALLMSLWTVTSMILHDLRLFSNLDQYDSAIQMEVRGAIFNYSHYFIGFIAYFPFYFIAGMLFNKLSLYLAAPITLLSIPSFLDLIISGQRYQDSEYLIFSVIGNILFYTYFLYRLLKRRWSPETKVETIIYGIGYGFFSFTIIYFVIMVMGSA